MLLWRADERTFAGQTLSREYIAVRYKWQVGNSPVRRPSKKCKPVSRSVRFSRAANFQGRLGDAVAREIGDETQRAGAVLKRQAGLLVATLVVAPFRGDIRDAGVADSLLDGGRRADIEPGGCEKQESDKSCESKRQSCHLGLLRGSGAG